MRREQWWPPGEGEHEVAFALELFTLELAVYTGPRDGADAWKKTYGPRYLTGTLDWIDWGCGVRVPHIDDLKTGHWEVDPAEAKQLRSYALLPWVRSGCPADWECWVSITTWERYPLDGEPTRKWHRLTAVDVMEHLEDLRWSEEHPREVNPVPIATKWIPGEPLSPCAFCDCRPQFPVAAWMTNHRYRAAPHCVPGMLKLIEESQ